MQTNAHSPSLAFSEKGSSEMHNEKLLGKYRDYK